MFKYLIDWSCPIKRQFYFGLIALDGPLVTIDFSMLLWWHQIAHYLLLIFDPHVGQLIQYGAGIGAIWLTLVRVRHFNKLMKQMDQKPPEND